MFFTSFSRKIRWIFLKNCEQQAFNFRPSSSADEKLPSEYTKAESYGKSGNCRKYEKHCGFNILDLFSKLS